MLGENLRALVESLTWFEMELLIGEKLSIGGKPVLGENLRAVVESLTWFEMETSVLWETIYRRKTCVM